MKAKVLYIMGTGRSGSTVLGITLGNLESVFYAGGLFAWPLFRGIPNTQQDAVKKFWEQVRADIPDAEDCFALDFHKRIEHHSAILRPWALFSRSMRSKYLRLHSQLYESIHKASGAETVVDSSHYPLRVLLLRKALDVDLRVLYLVRDPRQVVNALQKPVQRREPMKPAAANLYCLVVWFLASIVYRFVPSTKRMRVRYEDFTDDPAGVTRAIARFIGTEDDLEGFDDLAIGPIFHGNRIRNRESISIVAQPREDRLSPFWRTLTSILQFPLLLTHGYLRR